MCAFSRLVSLGRNLVRGKRSERDLSDEIACHLELLIARNLGNGLSDSEARRTALLEIGGVEQLKEQVREVRMGYHFEALILDLRYGARFLLRNPLFTLTAVLTLALGLGASTATFSLIKNRLLQPLSYTDGLLQIAAESPLRELHEADVSLPRFEQIRAQQDVFVDLAALAGERLTILRGDLAEQINVARVSDRFFRMLAVQPLRGRLFLPSENQIGGERVVLLSYGCWQTRFSGDLNIIGRSVTLGDARTTIVGVLPQNFAVPFGDFDVYLPGVSGVTFLGEEQMQRGAGFLKVIARPRPTVSLEQVRATLAAIDKRYRERAAENMDGNAVSRALPLRETVVRQARPALYAVAAAVVCLLILASINVVNLMLGRLARREREIAVRYALGAGHKRILQQLVSENILLAVMAGIIGVAFAWIGLTMIKGLGSDFLHPGEAKLDAAAVGFVMLLTFGNAFLFAIASALHAPRDPKGEALRQTSCAVRPALSSFRAFLLVTQVALSLLLATAAGLLLTSLHRIQSVDSGLDPEGVFVANISPPFNISTHTDNAARFVQRAIARLKSTPDISAAAAIYGLPLAHDDTFLSYVVADRTLGPLGARPVTWYRSVSPEYFSTMRIPLRMGRDFTEADRPGNQNVVILSETTARLLFGNSNPLGRKIICGGTTQTTYQVVGVVGDVRSLNLAQPVREEMYFSMFQSEEPAMKLIVRAASPDVEAKVIEEKIQACLHDLDPDQSATTIQTMRQIMARSVARGRFVAVALAFFATLALFVATIGIYGVMDYAASMRTREIGIRLALGAQRRDVIRLIVAHGMKLVAIGLLAGGLIALCSTHFLSTLLYDVSANDPLIFSGAILLLAAVAFLANYLPARRAMRIAPLAALQYE